MPQVSVSIVLYPVHELTLVQISFQGLDDIDPEEKDEEVSRMREHVIEHIDKDADGVIQLQEFINYANSQDFDHEDPWDAAFSAEFSEEDVRL